jgi:N-acetylmuramoyl-L-alanine amidase
MVYTQEDVRLLAKCAWLESRNQGIQGMYAVMHVVCNRIGAPGFPKTLQEVIMEPNAFSWTRPDDPQYGKEPEESDFLYQQALEDAEFILSGESDPTRGSVWYANEPLAGPWYRENIIGKPDEHPVMYVFKDHTFRK